MTEPNLTAEAYRVTAPYVTLRVRDSIGGITVRGFLEGGVVRGADIEVESLRHHLEGGMIEALGAPVVAEPAPVVEPVKELEPKVEEPAAKPGPKPKAG